MRTFLLATLGALLAACSNPKEVSITVTNKLDIDRMESMVEISKKEIYQKLGLADTNSLVIYNSEHKEIPYQMTSDATIIFPADVKANSKTQYTIIKGIPTHSKKDTLVYGRVFPERMDDLSWENDLASFRAYGPTLEKNGERGFGYDLFTKRGTPYPVLEQLYANELNKEVRARVNELKKTDMKAAKELEHTISYHIDHGYGMDCYAVGPTLGAGVTALINQDTIVYPWCYNHVEILDNGPLRFKAKLTFNPLKVDGNDNVIETRIITLDAGSHLNKTVISYENLDKTLPIVTGFALHDSISEICTDAAHGYMTYVDPTTGPNNGKIFLGAAFPMQMKDMKTWMFSDEERKMHGNAYGHLLAFSEYAPKSEYTYYWGFAWSRADIKNIHEWNEYMQHFTQELASPLEVTIK